MTVQEAKQQVEICERQITDAYDNLQKAVQSMGYSAAQAVSNKISPILPPLIMFLCLFDSIVIFILGESETGILILMIGGCVAVPVHVYHQSSITSVLNVIEMQQHTLNSILDDHSRI